MRVQTSYTRCTAVILGLLLVGGCGGSGDGRTPRVPVTGRVTFQGKAVNEAKVVFFPTSARASAAQATTDSDGRFSLTTFTPEDGAVPGTYVVLITKQHVLNPMTPGESRDYFARTGNAPPLPTVKELLPLKYKSHETTDLSVNVSVDEQNTFKFDLD